MRCKAYAESVAKKAEWLQEEMVDLQRRTTEHDKREAKTRHWAS